MKRWAAALATVGMVFGGVLALPQAAFAATDVSGNLTTSDGTTPIVGADIEFTSSTGDSFYSYTDVSGHFSTSSVPPGAYTVQFTATNFAPEYYDNTYVKSAATIVTVADGVPTLLNASLAAASTITGMITDASSNPVNNVIVSVYSEDSGWDMVAQAFTGPDGKYTIGSLPAGKVKVFAAYMFGGDLQGAWYTNGYSQATATVLAVPGPAGTVAADIVLPQGATIQGSIVDPIGSPVSVDVVATGAGLDGTESGGSGSDGHYAITGLHPQDYSVITDDSYWGLFAPAAPQVVSAVVGTPAHADFVVKPALVNESEFTDVVHPMSGPTSVEPGKTYTWKIALDGNENVYAILYSAPVYLGAVVRNGYGDVTITLTIPADTSAGAHKLTFSGMNNLGEGTELIRQYFPITVTSPSLAATGVSSAATAGMGTLALLLCGVGVLALWFSRRRAAPACKTQE